MKVNDCLGFIPCTFLVHINAAQVSPLRMVLSSNCNACDVDVTNTRG